MYGYHGAYDRIDATALRCARIVLDAGTLHARLGGVGLASELLLREQPAGVDAFDPGSVLILAFGPLVGTALTTSAKFAVVGKSPLTQRFCDSLSSSQFALAGKATGADAIVVAGACRDWSVLIIDDGRLTALPAGEWLGRSARETEAGLRARIGTEFEILCIGPAAENLVRYAGISHDGRHAGRGGLGAILGSKKIKAIAVRGSQRTLVADAGKVIEQARDLSKRSLGPATEKYRELGTIANLLTFNRLALLPTRNFTAASFDAAESISGEALATMTAKTRKSCARCTIGCEHIFATSTGGSVRIEYETLFALGSLCGVGDRDMVLTAAAECDRVGIDTVSFGVTFAFACECVERGWLAMPAELELRFGNGPGLIAAVDLVAKRQGIGNLLALGTRRLAQRIGPEALAIAAQVKGMEIPGYDPAKLPITAVGFAVNPRGADHNRSGGYEVDFSGRTDRGKPGVGDVALLVAAEDRAALLDSMILCKFVRGVFTDLFAESAALLHAVTGHPHTAESLRKSAGEIVRLKRQFNEREGWTPAEDALPPRFLQDRSGLGRKDAVLDARLLTELVAEYYRLRGLDSTGRVPAPTC